MARRCRAPSCTSSAISPNIPSSSRSGNFSKRICLQPLQPCCQTREGTLLTRLQLIKAKVVIQWEWHNFPKGDAALNREWFARRPVHADIQGFKGETFLCGVKGLQLLAHPCTVAHQRLNMFHHLTKA